MDSLPERSSNAQDTFSDVPFKTLGSCHEDIAHMLDEMDGLAGQLERASSDEALREKARTIHLFFSGHAIEHHLDEERHVFPALLESGGSEWDGMVQKLQRHHALLEKRWTNLGPQLHRVARGYPVPCGPLRQEMRLFVEFYRGHMALEDAEIYPLARGLLDAGAVCAMNQDMARRRIRGPEGEFDDEWG